MAAPLSKAESHSHGTIIPLDKAPSARDAAVSFRMTPGSESTPPISPTDTSPKKRKKPKSAPAPQHRAGARILLSRIFVAIVLVVLLFGKSQWIARGPLWAEAFLILGLFPAAIAMAGRMWCSLFIAGRKNAALVTQGPYAHCRNPLYFFSFVGAVGLGLATGMLTIAALIAIAFLLYYPAVIRGEEAYLRARHGTPFDDYCRTVPSFWPTLRPGPAGNPESLECHPHIFRKHLGSAIWFPIGCGIIHCFSLLQGAIGLPVWFTLP
jgi:protein-S-isoprenylcysteine O-methyltransferase Ste14